jgi:DnaJ domain
MSEMLSPDYYKILQVDPLAEEEVIEVAYRRLARKYHPDVYAGPDADERMRELNRAYGVIGNAASRRAYDSARQQEATRQAMAEQVRQSMARRTTTGRQRAVTASTLAQHPPAHGDDLLSHHSSKEVAMRRMQSKVPSVKVSTGDWPAITPTTGKLPVTPRFVYHRPLSQTVFEELRNLGQGFLVIGLLGYPMAVAVFWFPLQILWSHLQLSQHQALIFTLALLLPPMLALSWWFGRRIRQDRL